MLKPIRFLQDISHDPAVNEAYTKDPLVKFIGTLRGVSDMLSGVGRCRAPTLLRN
jgi:hypothetical protein